jgi:hypothetical protein
VRGGCVTCEEVENNVAEEDAHNVLLQSVTEVSLYALARTHL